MPADSETRTWRPVGARIAGLIAIGVLIVMVAVAWIAWGPHIRANFSTSQRLTIVGMFVMLFLAWWAMARSRLTAAPDHVTVVNGYRTRTFEWAQVVNFRLRHGAPWAELDLSDGTTLAVFGVQGSDGRTATSAVREFRALLEAHSPPEPPLTPAP